jgi:hypothetical protein
MFKPLALALLLSGCGSLQFNDGWVPGAAHFYDETPYVVASVGETCAVTTTVLMIPSSKQSVTFHNGYGTSNLTTSFQNGGLSSVGQQTDSKVPETITSLGLATNLPKLMSAKLGATAPTGTPRCDTKSVLFKIVDGNIDPSSPVRLNIN